MCVDATLVADGWMILLLTTGLVLQIHFLFSGLILTGLSNCGFKLSVCAEMVLHATALAP
jgi:hypothetical protein